jgi:hypothetical protein
MGCLKLEHMTAGDPDFIVSGDIELPHAPRRPGRSRREAS